MRAEMGPAAGLVRLSFLVQSAYAEVGRACELSTPQAQLLCVLTDGPVGMAELAGTLGLERSSLTGLVDRAEHRGLVTRQPDPTDRRATRVTLTRSGTRALHRFHNQLSDRLETLLADLTPAGRTRFVHTLNELVADAPPVFTD